MEIAIVITIVIAALAFTSWRVWNTVRVAQGNSEAKACGGCKSCPSD